MALNRVFLLCIIAGLLVSMQVMKANGDLDAAHVVTSCNGDDCPTNLEELEGVDPVKRHLQEDPEGTLNVMGHVTVMGH